MTITGDDLATSLAGFARGVQRQSTRHEVLDTMVSGALRLVPGADQASVSPVVSRRRVVSQAASSDLRVRSTRCRSRPGRARASTRSGTRAPWRCPTSQHAAPAYAATQLEAALERALLTRQVVGQVKGILVERGRVTAEQAFAQLTRASRTADVELHEVARRLVETGDLSVAG